ncbi:MAG: hypothetical protein PWR07_880 [Bacillota bacterium]|nr:hypothetical protein [Bacillota bacterium]
MYSILTIVRPKNVKHGLQMHRGGYRGSQCCSSAPAMSPTPVRM